MPKGSEMKGGSWAGSLPTRSAPAVSEAHRGAAAVPPACWHRAWSLWGQARKRMPGIESLPVSDGRAVACADCA